MKKNKLKTIIAFLLVGATSPNLLYSAEQPQEYNAYQMLKDGASNATYASMGYKTGTGLVDDVCALAKLSLFNIKNRDAHKGRQLSLKVGYTLGIHLFTLAGMSMLSKATLGLTHGNLEYFVHGLLVGTAKETLLRLSSYITTPKQKPELCSICQNEGSPLNADPTNIFIVHLSKQKLRCEHEFHTKCINRWTAINPTCPICRASVHSD